MRPRRRVLWLSGLTILVVARLAMAEVLTNETVVTMVKAGLGEELILSKLKASQTQFDVSTDSILKLKREGVSDKIIQTMIETAGKQASPAPAPPAAPAPAPVAPAPATPAVVTPMVPSAMPFVLGPGPIAFPNSSSLFVKSGDRVAEVPPVAAQVQHSVAKHFIPFYFGPGDNWFFLRGPKSAVRIPDRQPMFYTKQNPSSFYLVQLTYQAEKDIRYVVATGTVFKNTVPITINRRPDESFELSPKSVLAPGEYAFVSSYTFYDFGIE